MSLDQVFFRKTYPIKINCLICYFSLLVFLLICSGGYLVRQKSTLLRRAAPMTAALTVRSCDCEVVLLQQLDGLVALLHTGAKMGENC